ncbi:MAG TPA: hypothetical protein VKB51_05155 [bacterium]|nr:hypothetical protein [bacterium]
MLISRGSGFAALVALLLVSHVAAASDDGLSVFGGPSSYTSSGTISSGTFSGDSFSIKGSGLSLGVNYQIALDPNLSVNPFLILATESASSSQLVYDHAMHTAYGAQLRYRVDNYFFGGGLGVYSEAVSGGSGGSATGSGIGVNFGGGWQRVDGLFVSGQIDLANLSYPDGSSHLTGIHVNVGYRWKSLKGLLYHEGEVPEAPPEDAVPASGGQPGSAKAAPAPGVAPAAAPGTVSPGIAVPAQPAAQPGSEVQPGAEAAPQGDTPAQPDAAAPAEPTASPSESVAPSEEAAPPPTTPPSEEAAPTEEPAPQPSTPQ